MNYNRLRANRFGAAYAHFFARRADFPRFKKKGQSDSFRYPQGVKLDRASSRIFLPKPGWLHYRNSRDVLGTVKNVTVSQSFEDLQVRNMSRSAAGSTE